MYYMVNFLPPNTNYNKSRKICGVEKRISWGIDMRNSKDYENRGAYEVLKENWGNAEILGLDMK